MLQHPSSVIYFDNFIKIFFEVYDTAFAKVTIENPLHQKRTGKIVKAKAESTLKIPKNENSKNIRICKTYKNLLEKVKTTLEN